MLLTPYNNNSHSLYIRCVLSLHQVPYPWLKLFIGYRHQTKTNVSVLLLYIPQKYCITLKKNNICPLQKSNKATGMSFPPLRSECPPVFLLTRKQNIMLWNPLKWRNVCNTSYVPIVHSVQKTKRSHTNGMMTSLRLILSLYGRNPTIVN